MLFWGLDECQCAKITPLFDPWQYASVIKCSLPLYIEESSFMVGICEDVPVSSVITRIEPPDEIIQLNTTTDIYEALSIEVSMYNINILC